MNVARLVLLALVGGAAAPPAAAQEPVRVSLDGGEVVVRNVGVAEPSVPVTVNGQPAGGDGVRPGGLFNAAEVFSRTGNTNHFPLVTADLIANTYVRAAYQKPDGPGAHLGTSVVASPSFRTPDRFHFLPAAVRADLRTGGADRVRTELTAMFGDALANATSVRTFPAPAPDRTTVGLLATFQARRYLLLDPNLRGNDAFRLVTLSSMYAGDKKYDANVLRFEDGQGQVRVVRVGPATPRGQHLFPRPVEVGGWVELVKEPGSDDWFPDSPSVRLDIRDRSRVPGKLGVQGFLAASTNPNDDSLNVWLEWLDAPAVLNPGLAVGVGLEMTATPPARVPGS